MQYEDEVIEPLTVGSIDTLNTDVMPIETIKGLAAAYGRAAAETISVTLVVRAAAGVPVRQSLTVRDAQVVAGRYKPILTDQAAMGARIAVAEPVRIAQTMTVAPAVRVTEAVTVVEALALPHALAGVARYRQTLTQALTVHDALARFFGADVAETVTLAPTIAPGYRGHVGAAEALTVAEALGPALVLKVTLADGVDITPAEAIKMLYHPTVVDGVTVEAGYIRPDGSFTTWAINARTNAVTEYTGFQFNSFTQMGLRYLAASDTGLYALEGVTDDSADIIANIKTGLAQFAGSRFSAVKGVYLGLRGEGEFYVIITDGAGVERMYKVLTAARQTQKVQIGKGIRTRYMSFELVSTGQDFDLDTIEIMPIQETRRV